MGDFIFDTMAAMSGVKIHLIRRNIVGAPFAIGDRVLVVKVIDEEGDASFIGKSGIVEYLNYNCGCGQTFPADPMIGVKFEDGRSEEFWKDELEKHERN